MSQRDFFIKNGIVINGGVTELSQNPTISSGTLTLDLSTGSIFTVNLSSSITTLNIINPSPTGSVSSFCLNTVGTGTAIVISWPSGVKWPSGTAPTVTTTNGKQDLYTFFTLNNGNNYFGIISGQNF